VITKIRNKKCDQNINFKWHRCHIPNQVHLGERWDYLPLHNNDFILSKNIDYTTFEVMLTKRSLKLRKNWIGTKMLLSKWHRCWRSSLGHPHDRREYLPLYYDFILCKILVTHHL